MRSRIKRGFCLLLTAVLWLACALPVSAAGDFALSATQLYTGENIVNTLDTATTLYVFRPEQGAYLVEVEDATAVLSYWHGSKFYVSGLAQTADDGSLMLECTSTGQTLLIGLSGVATATITITEQEGYVAPEAVVFESYVNVHTPVDDFAMPAGTLINVDVTRPQTVVADAEGIYHWGSVDGPILYVNMRAATYADLYACYHPTSGSAAMFLRGRYEDEEGKIQGYDFLDAMRPYADALDEDGYYYLTVDLATYLQLYGENQGWFRQDSSDFPIIKQGRFIQESAWLVNACYVEQVKLNCDVNGDGKENNKDLGLLQQYLAGWPVTLAADSGDVNGDGVLNNKDLGSLQQYLAGWA